MTDTHPRLDVRHLCRLARLSRATYYRQLADVDEEGLDP